MKLKLVVLLLSFALLGIFSVLLLKNNSRQATSVTPTPEVVKQRSGWVKHEIPEAKLVFEAPEGISFRSEYSKDENSVTMYLEKGSMQENNYYQLYGIYKIDDNYIEGADLEGLEAELEPKSLKYVFVDNRKALQGQMKGERNRFVTYIFANGLFSLFTSQPTEENESLTDSIIATFDFHR